MTTNENETAENAAKEAAENLRQYVDTIKPEIVDQVLRSIPAQPAVVGEKQERAKAAHEFGESLRKLAHDEVGSVQLGASRDYAIDENIGTSEQTGNVKELMRTKTADQIIRPDIPNAIVDKYADHRIMSAETEQTPTIDAVSASRFKEGQLRSFEGLSSGMETMHAAIMSVIVPVSEVALENAVESLDTLIASLAGQAFSLLRDRWLLGQLGKNEGIFDNDDVQKVTTSGSAFATLKEDNLLEAISLLDEDSAKDPLMVMSRSVKYALAKERTSAGAPIWDRTDLRNNVTSIGTPMDTTSLLPKISDASQAGKEFAFMADMSKVLHGIRQTITVTKSREGVLVDNNGKVVINALQQGLVLFQFSTREDLILRHPEKNFVKFVTAAS